jgi:hypothetical protein
MTANSDNTELEELLKIVIGTPVDHFEPFAFYNRSGDCIELFLTNDMFYGDYIDNYLTIYRNIETDKIVGLLINNVHKLFK